MNAPIFIGYATLEKLLETHAGSTIYFSKCIETNPSDVAPFRRLEFYLVAAVVPENGTVHYWRFKTGAALQHGRDIDEKTVAAEARTKDAFDLLWYEINVFDRFYPGKRARSALVAFPKDYKYIDGDTDLIRYVEATDTYTLEKAKEAVA